MYAVMHICPLHVCVCMHVVMYLCDCLAVTGAFLGSGLTAAVTLCRRAVTTKRRDSVQRKTGWRQNILRQLRDRNEREVLAFRDSIGASEGVSCCTYVNCISPQYLGYWLDTLKGNTITGV